MRERACSSKKMFEWSDHLKRGRKEGDEGKLIVSQGKGGRKDENKIIVWRRVGGRKQ